LAVRIDLTPERIPCIIAPLSESVIKWFSTKPGKGTIS
jgi:hypothetical protein